MSIVFAVSAAMILLSACKVAAPVHLTKARAMPATFGKSVDTASLGRLSWRDYFADTVLVSLIDTALRYNFDMQRAIQRVEIARADALIQRNALLPAVSAGATAQVDRFGKYTMNGVGNFDTNLSQNISDDQKISTRPTPYYFLGLRSAWEVDLWGKLRNNRKAAQLRLLASEQGRRLVTTMVVAEAAQGYYDWLGLRFELEVVQRNINLQTRVVQVTEVQKLAGHSNELAVQQARAQLLRTRSLEFQIAQQIVSAENRLNRLLGRYPQGLPSGPNILDQKLPTLVQTGVPAQMLRFRPDVFQAEIGLAATKANVDAARAAFYPSLVLTPYFGFEAFRASLLLNPASIAWGAAAGLAAPLVNRAPIRANYKVRQAEYMTAWYDYQQTSVNAYQEVVTNLNGIENYRLAVDLKVEEVTAQRKAVEIANDLYRTGFSNYLEVITAQRNALEAELGMVDAKRQAFFFSIDLYRSLGGGWQ